MYLLYTDIYGLHASSSVPSIHATSCDRERSLSPTFTLHFQWQVQTKKPTEPDFGILWSCLVQLRWLTCVCTMALVVNWEECVRFSPQCFGRVF